MRKLSIFKENEELFCVEIDKYTEDKPLVIGRASECQVCFPDKEISRKHLLVFVREEKVVFECISRYGKIRQLDDSLLKELEVSEDVDFFMESYQVKLEVRLKTKKSDNVANSTDVGELQVEGPFLKEIETTQITDNSQSSSCKAYLKILSGAPAKDIALKIGCMVVGRDEKCDVVISSHCVSRRHFEISVSSGQYFITDLGSANGLALNSQKLEPSQPTPICSGDKLKIKNLTLQFEIRDTRLESLIESSLPVGFPPPNPEIAVAPVQQKGYNKVHVALAVLAVLGGVGYFLSNEKQEKTPDRAISSEKDEGQHKKEGFAALTVEQQAMVESSYQLARQLFTSSQYELALLEIKKLHRILPHYLDSKQIEMRCRQSLDLLERKEARVRMEQEKAHAQQRVIQIIKHCEQGAFQSPSLSRTQACLSPALILDPENSRAAALMSKVEALIQQKASQLRRQASHKSSVAQGVALFRQAEKVEKSGRLLDAIDAYQKHMRGHSPDPGKHKEKSKKRIQKLKSQVEKSLQKYIREANKAANSGDQKMAVLTLRKALALDPSYREAHEKNRAAIATD